VRRGASVLADGFGPGAHRLPGTAQRFLPYEGWATDGHDMSCTYTADRQVILRRVRRVREAAIAVLAILRYKVAIDVAWTPDLRCLHNRVFQHLAIVELYMSFPHSVI
jgi:hypothetical protein